MNVNSEDKTSTALTSNRRWPKPSRQSQLVALLCTKLKLMLKSPLSMIIVIIIPILKTLMAYMAKGLFTVNSKPLPDDWKIKVNSHSARSYVLHNQIMSIVIPGFFFL
jgi:hypothetical protein